MTQRTLQLGGVGNRSWHHLLMLLLLGTGMWPGLKVRSTGLELVPVSVWPEAPARIRQAGVAVVGSHAVVTGISPSGLYVFDMSVEGVPPIVGRLSTPELSREIVAAGDKVLALDTEGRLMVFDLARPAQPRLLGVWMSGLESYDLRLAVSGAHAYVVGTRKAPPGTWPREWEVRAVDWSDPTEPREVGCLALDSGWGGVKAAAADGDHLCLVVGDTALRVADVRNPAQPRWAGVHQSSWERGDSVAVSGSRAFFASSLHDVSVPSYWRSRVEVIDLAHPDGPAPLGFSQDTFAPIDSLAVAGSRVYVARGVIRYGGWGVPGEGSFDILDVSDPAAPVWAGSIPLISRLTEYPTLGSPRVAVAGELAVLGTTMSLLGFDVSDPQGVALKSDLTLTGSSADVVISGQRAVVSREREGLAILDLTDPARPKTLSHIELPDPTHRLAVSGDHAYSGNVHVHTVDISDPDQPQLTSTWTTQQGVGWVEVSGQVLCALEYYNGGLRVFSLENPAAPRRMGFGSIRYRENPTDLAMDGQRALVTSGFRNQSTSLWTGALDIFDVSNPASPRRLRSYNLPWRPGAVAASGNLALVSGSAPAPDGKEVGVVQVLDLADPAQPVKLADIELDRAGDFGGVSSMVLVDRTAYLGRFLDDELIANKSAVVMLDFSDPVRPRRMAGFAGAEGSRVRVSGDHLFLAGGGTVTTLAVRPASLPLSGTHDLEGTAFGLATLGSTLLVAAGEAGLLVLDGRGSTPGPVLGRLSTLGIVRDATLDGTRAYLAAGEEGLVMVDVADPAAPRRLGSFDTPGDARRVLVVGSTAYVADGSGGVQIIDISQPDQPRLLATHSTSGPAVGLALEDDRLWVACLGDGLVGLEVRNPAQPRRIAGYNRGGRIGAVALHRGRVVVADGQEGLAMLEFDETTGLRRVGVIEGGGPARDIVMHGDRAYVADARFGMKLYDLSDPTQPRMLGGNSTLDAQRSVVAGNRLVVAGARDGLSVFPLASSESPLALEVLPGSSPGSLSLRLNGPAGTTAIVQRSSNLATWTDGPGVTLGATPVTLSIPVTEDGEFFRLKKP
ncbi:MAG: hypothetical protein HS113_07165 [Verrucomicrobiales bacterium]|nr:hypothetical protein [Verrucomicrobiales bacterium]